jgi:hypothetical protein
LERAALRSAGVTPAVEGMMWAPMMLTQGVSAGARREVQIHCLERVIGRGVLGVGGHIRRQIRLRSCVASGHRDQR